MKLVIQRVDAASVEVSGKVVGKISKGLFVLLGIKKGDAKKDSDFLVNKLTKLRVMSDLPAGRQVQNDKMNLSVLDTNTEILLVSQFTLYANTKDGNRPSFIEAEEPKKAEILYDYFIEKLKQTGLNIQTGKFGAYMKIKTILDGPVTILLEN